MRTGGETELDRSDLPEERGNSIRQVLKCELEVTIMQTVFGQKGDVCMKQQTG